MRLSRKFQKLFSRDAGRKPLGKRLPLDSSGELAPDSWQIDQTELENLRERYPYRPNARKINAYEDAAYWIGVNVKRAQDLWLDRSPPLQILDLGSGAGYFLYLCRLFGHEGLGFDQDEEPFFRGTTDFFKVRRVIGRIEPQTPLPDLGRKFDLVTGHRVCFHRLARTENGEWLEWTPADWKFFIKDIRTRFLKPKGRLLLEFNRRQDGSSFFTDELRAFFESQGARIFRWKALLAADPNQRPRFKEGRHQEMLVGQVHRLPAWQIGR